MFQKRNRLHFSKSELIAWVSEGRKKSVSEINQRAFEIAKSMDKKMALAPIYYRKFEINVNDFLRKAHNAILDTIRCIKVQ